MEQDRFDALAKKVFVDGSSRRRVIGGALASVLGVGVAAVAGTDAKNKKAKAQGKNKKGKAKGEFVCSGSNFPAPTITNPCPLGSCCQSTPAGVSAPGCIPAAQQSATGVVGDAGGGNGVCITCPTGTQADPISGRCVCSALSCPDGCCVDNTGFSSTDQCIANGSGAPVNSVNPGVDGSYVCGTGGVSCAADSSICSIGTLFTGCCSAQGFCVAGTSNSACGSGGNLCETCQNDSSCGIDQACTGGTTTTTASPTTTPIACVAPKFACGSNCCGRKQKCILNKDGVTQRCRKRHKN